MSKEKSFTNTSQLMDKIVSLAKRRGFVFQSSEIYGGLNGAWDYGPLGVDLLRNIKDEWWKAMTYREDIEGIDAAILMHPRVWEASGHVENFTDPMCTCRHCKKLFRADQVWEMLKDSEWVKSFAKTMELTDWNNLLKFNSLRTLQWSEHKGKKLAPGLALVRNPQVTMSWLVEDLTKNPEMMLDAATLLQYLATEQKAITGLQTPCPNCGGDLTEPRQFNLMFKTFVGPVEDASAVVYLRPETAQGIFVNFLNVQNASRQKIPFGIAQMGKAFRNEINTKNFLFRTREFEQMEMQYFVKPAEDDKWFEYWREQRMQWFINLGMKKDKLQWHRHEPDKLAHYAKDAYDIEYQFPFGWGEIEGIHNRTDYDLRRHEQYSGKSLQYFDDQTKEKFTPYIIETSVGASRSFMAFLIDAYHEEEAPTAEGTMELRTVLKFHPKLAPVKAAIFPLVNRDGMPEIAKKIEHDLRPSMRVFYDDAGAVGRRYRRQDEAGTPFCITVDSQTLHDQTVTVRDRDSMVQERVASDQLKKYLLMKLSM